MAEVGHGAAERGALCESPRRDALTLHRLTHMTTWGVRGQLASTFSWSGRDLRHLALQAPLLTYFAKEALKGEGQSQKKSSCKMLQGASSRCLRGSDQLACSTSSSGPVSLRRRPSIRRSPAPAQCAGKAFDSSGEATAFCAQNWRVLLSRPIRSTQYSTPG